MIIPQRLSKTRACGQAIANLKGKGQPARIIQYLASNSGALSAQVAAACSCGNVSDACCRANDKLTPLGWRIVGRLPKPKSTTKFGDESNQYEWRIERVR